MSEPLQYQSNRRSCRSLCAHDSSQTINFQNMLFVCSLTAGDSAESLLCPKLDFQCFVVDKRKRCHLSDNSRMEEAEIRGFRAMLTPSYSRGKENLPFSLHKRCSSIKYVHIVPMQGTLFSSLFSRDFRQCLHLNHTQHSSTSFTTAIHRLKKSFLTLYNIHVHGDFSPYCTVSSCSTYFSLRE